MKLNFFDIVLSGLEEPAPQNRPEIGDDERTEWIKLMQHRLESVGSGEALSEEFEVKGEKLSVVAHIFGKSIGAVWLSDSSPVAASLFLRGLNGADDVAAVESIKEFRPELPIKPKDYNAVQAKERPTLAAVYLDVHWYNTARVELLTTALTLAHLSAPGGTPTMAIQKPPTPEEEAALRARVEKVVRVFEIIETDWRKRNRLKYTVRASAPIKGKPVKDIKNVTFWTGAQGQGETLDVDELVAVFKLLQSNTEQLKGAKYLKEIKTSSVVSLRHDDPMIAAVLAQINIVEPDRDN